MCDRPTTPGDTDTGTRSTSQPSEAVWLFEERRRVSQRQKRIIYGLSISCHFGDFSFVLNFSGGTARVLRAFGGPLLDPGGQGLAESRRHLFNHTSPCLMWRLVFCVYIFLRSTITVE